MVAMAVMAGVAGQVALVATGVLAVVVTSILVQEALAEKEAMVGVVVMEVEVLEVQV